MTDSIFQRNRLLLGNKAIEAIGRARVIVFGVGGVGSWCVESLVRSGIKDITRFRLRVHYQHQPPAHGYDRYCR